MVSRLAVGRMVRLGLLIGLFGFTAAATQARTSSAACQKVVLEGDVNAGQEWKSAIGDGWVFRVVPIAPGRAGYSGWDLVVDRVQPAGFPDALLLATLPYNSINEREIGTTFGLRAQDAIGWNPRSFRFLTDPAALHEGQQLFSQLLQPSQSQPGEQVSRAAHRLLELESRASPGLFRILDARITPGVSDAASYAESWALASPRTPHQVVAAPAGGATPFGSFVWLRFSTTLWLPRSWVVPAYLHAEPVPCAP